MENSEQWVTFIDERIEAELLDLAKEIGAGMRELEGDLRQEIQKLLRAKLEVVKINFGAALYTMMKSELFKAIEPVHQSQMEIWRELNELKRKDATGRCRHCGHVDTT